MYCERGVRAYICDHGMCVVTMMIVVDMSYRGCHDESHETSK